MKFSTYDMLSSLIPGFTILFVLFHYQYVDFNKDFLLPYTGIAFIIGYFVNTLSSWAEDLLFLTWGGEPTTNLLDGKDIWKVKFYSAQEAKNKLTAISENKTPNNKELFQIAMRYAAENEKVSALNATYIFSRVLFMTILICAIIIILNHYQNPYVILGCFLFLFVAWLRCKQRGYYFAREVLNVYLKK